MRPPLGRVRMRSLNFTASKFDANNGGERLSAVEPRGIDTHVLGEGDESCCLGEFVKRIPPGRGSSP